MSETKFIYTTAIKKIRAMSARKCVVEGGTSAGKTYAIIPILIDQAAKHPGLKITVVAETIPAVKDGAVDIFKEVMRNTKRWIESGWIGNPMEYTFKNGSRIQFKAFDNVGKAKASGKRDILFINEANHVAYHIADALMIRSKKTYLDYNPDAEFWAHTEVLEEPNSEFLRLTYEDNEALPIETLEDLLIKKDKAFFDPEEENLHDPKNIRSSYWANWWKVYGEGKVGNLEGAVFNNWKQIDTIPPDAKLLGYGQDFGYTNDPTTLIALYSWQGKLILDELLFRTGMLPPDIHREIQKHKKAKVYADGARPDTIEQIKRLGSPIVGEPKKEINYGIELLLEYGMLVTSRSLNLIKELRRYLWALDKNGVSINEPIKYWNHLLDGLRYVAIAVLGVKKRRYIRARA